jgi:hypothetical protein
MALFIAGFFCCKTALVTPKGWHTHTTKGRVLTIAGVTTLCGLGHHVGRACSSHQFCRGFARRGHRDRSHLLRRHEERLLLAIYVSLPMTRPERRPRTASDPAVFLPNAPGGTCTIRSRRINIITNRKPPSVVRSSFRSGSLSASCVLAEMNCHIQKESHCCSTRATFSET